MPRTKAEIRVSYEPLRIDYYVNGKKSTKEEYLRVVVQNLADEAVNTAFGKKEDK